MEFIDSHIHLQDYKTKDINNIIKNAFLSGVTKFINVSAHPSDWPAIDELAAQYPQIIPAYGIHPWYISGAPANWQTELERRLQNNPKACVGECGIDRIKNGDTEAQIKILLPHIELAQKYHRPLIIHSVKADAEMQKLFSKLPRHTVFHSFTGSAEWGKDIQRHGFFIGLNFSVLRKKNRVEILQNLDINQILLETDGPYQNIDNSETLPENLPSLAVQIAPIFNISTEQFTQTIMQNGLTFTGE